LKGAYENSQEAAPDGQQRPWDERIPPPTGESSDTDQLDQQVKADIEAAEEQQIEDEQAEAEASPPPAPGGPPSAVDAGHPPAALDPTQRIFVVSSDLTVSTATGRECELTAGDVITRLDDTPGEDGMVRVSVLSSRPHDCDAGAITLVGSIDLQEMHNDFRVQLDSALDSLASNQGRGGLPPAPDTTTTAGEVPPPTPDANVESKLQDQQREATEAEVEVQQQIQAEQPPARP
jgi:hypothetical protein